MTVSKMKKITFLAEKEYIDDVILPLQSYQAIELTSPNVAIQNEYYSEHANDLGEDANSRDELFETETYKKELNRYTNQLDDVVEYIEFLEEILPKPGFFAQLNQEKDSYTLNELHDLMKDTDISVLLEQAKKIQTTVNKLKEQKIELIEEKSFLKRWDALDFNPKETKDFKMMTVIVGAIDAERDKELKNELSHFNELYLEEIHYSEEETQYLIVVSNAELHDVEQVLIRHRFDRLEYEYDELPEQELTKNKELLAEINEHLKHLEEQPERVTELLKELKLAEEYLFNVRERTAAKEEVLLSQHLFVASGWIEENVVDLQIKAIKEVIGDDNLYTYVEDVKEDEEADVPVKLSNRKSASAFEGTVEMYSLPSYNELDPTSYVQPFSILFFGMMTADAGYGLLGLIATTLGLKFLDLSDSMKENFQFFRQLMLGTTAVGLFFGSFFGFDLPFQVMSITDQLIEVMGISIAIGFVHLLLGLFLNTVTNNRKGEYARSYIDGYSWMLILVGAAILAVNMLLSGPSIWNTVGLGLIILNLIGIVVVNLYASDSIAGGLGNGLFGLLDITSYIGDIISYTRLAALGVAGANIGMAFNLVIGMLPPIFRFTFGVLLFVALHLFNMMISMISGYVHTLRLNYVEFFGKFYQGGGKAFKPIPLLQKHIHIKTNGIE